jgi:hypothetical protein
MNLAVAAYAPMAGNGESINLRVREPSQEAMNLAPESNVTVNASSETPSSKVEILTSFMLLRKTLKRSSLPGGATEIHGSKSPLLIRYEPLKVRFG